MTDYCIIGIIAPNVCTTSSDLASLFELTALGMRRGDLVMRRFLIPANKDGGRAVSNF